ncbi:uncharacterized protein METZ01_LOCUS315263 [marine metagenome]|uniref:Uncharacterized protein n=1 Tax=marine metagenome TaxID=408172 RepID=A0A382NMI7_9ZZZZ
MIDDQIREVGDTDCIWIVYFHNFQSGKHLGEG